MEQLLSELDDRLTTVKRWTILRTIKQQSVAEHEFNVQRIAIRVASWFGINDHGNLFRLSQAALHHDDREALTSDIPFTAKYFVKEGESGIDTGATLWYDGLPADSWIRPIVKMADLLEAIHFLTIEIHMGNHYVEVHRDQMIERLFVFIRHQKEWPDHIIANCTEWINSIERDKYSKRYMAITK